MGADRRLSAVKARLSRHAGRVSATRRSLLAWFRRRGREFPWRDPAASQYVLVSSELLLQRTRAETIAGFFPRFLARFPSWEHLANATDSQMQAFLEPIGLWRRRAAALRGLGKEMQSREGCFPKSRVEIESLPGIGQYVASAVMMFCHGVSEPLLDVNMARVLERVFGSRKLADIRYDPWLQLLARALVRSRRPRQVNWAVLDLAATICTMKHPRCPICPIKETCLYAKRRRSPLPTAS